MKMWKIIKGSLVTDKLRVVCQLKENTSLLQCINIHCGKPLDDMSPNPQLCIFLCSFHELLHQRFSPCYLLMIFSVFLIVNKKQMKPQTTNLCFVLVCVSKADISMVSSSVP